MTKNTTVPVDQAQIQGLTVWINTQTQAVSVGLEESWYARSVVSLPIDLSEREVHSQLREELHLQYPSESDDWLIDYVALNEAPPLDGLRTWVVYALANKHMAHIRQMCVENQWRLAHVAPLATLAQAQLSTGVCFYPSRQQRQRQLWRKRCIKGALGLCVGLILSLGLGSGYSLANAYWSGTYQAPQELVTSTLVKHQPLPEPWMVKEFERAKQPLEFYNLSDVRLVGFIQQGNNTHALIRVNGQPSLGVQSLRIGDYLGKNFGRVQQMTDNAIAIKELQQDTSGAWSENEISLQLLADNS